MLFTRTHPHVYASKYTLANEIPAPGARPGVSRVLFKLVAQHRRENGAKRFIERLAGNYCVIFVKVISRCLYPISVFLLHFSKLTCRLQPLMMFVLEILRLFI